MNEMYKYYTLEEFKEQPFCLPRTDERYIHPEPKDVATLLKLAGWSQNDAAKLVGVSHDVKRGSSTIRKWKSDKAKKEYREIPYSAWRLMLLYAGVVQVDN